MTAVPASVPTTSGSAESAAEQVVLVDDAGRPIGIADKATVHGPTTPRHLAFSCYLFAFDNVQDGPPTALDPRTARLLMTHRARSKSTFPGVLTNTCCGHPAPGESLEDAATRRLIFELGIDPADVPELRVVLPEFSYRAFDGRVEENEFCPVLVGWVPDDLATSPRADEVDDVQWWRWSDVVAVASDAASPLSAWARRQVPELDEAFRTA